MRGLIGVGWACGLVCILALGVGLRAGAAAPYSSALVADYRLGQRYQADRQWHKAEKQYLKVLADDARAVWVYLPLAKVYASMNDPRKALICYQRYLSWYPKDTATKAAADQLRALVSDEGPARESSGTASATGDGGRSGLDGDFSVRLEGGLESNSGSDLAGLYTADGATPTLNSTATELGAGADYTWHNGFTLGLDFVDGPSRSYTIKVPGSGEVDSWTVDNLTFLLTPGWRFRIGSLLAVEPLLGLGTMRSSLHWSDNRGDLEQIYDAGGFVLWPKARVELLFGSWGLGAEAGYAVAEFSPVKSSSGTEVEQTNASGGVSSWSVQNGGLSLGLFVAHHFNAPH